MKGRWNKEKALKAKCRKTCRKWKVRDEVRWEKREERSAVRPMFHESDTNIRMWRPAEIKTPALPTWTHTLTKEVRIYRQRENKVKHGPAETEERERRQTSVRWRRNGWWEVFMAPTQDCTAAQRWRSLWLEQKKKRSRLDVRGATALRGAARREEIMDEKSRKWCRLRRWTSRWDRCRGDEKELQVWNEDGGGVWILLFFMIRERGRVFFFFF